MEVAKAKGRLRGKQPKLKPNQAKHLLELHNSGKYTQSEFAELFRGRTIHGVPDHRGDATQATRTAAAIRTSRASLRERCACS
jgi:hypothetical protein